MSLRVICPEGCRFLLPLSEAGHSVTCPECNTRLDVPEVSQTLRRGDRAQSELVIVSATNVEKTRKFDQDPGPSPDIFMPVVISTEGHGSEGDFTGRPANDRFIRPIDSGPVLPSIEAVQSSFVPTQEDLELPEIVLDDDRLEAFEARQNVRAFETSRRSVARIIAFLMAVVGMSNVVLALWQSGWLEGSTTERLQMWATVSILIGMGHLAYAFFLSQVADWSANWVVAAFLLAVAAGYACGGVLLGFAGVDNVFVQWLELPTMLKTKGSIWSTCMVLVSASLAWWCGREAMHWRQTVRWLRSF